MRGVLRVLVPMFITAWWCPVSSADRPATLTAAELRDLIMKTQNRIHSLQVEYRSDDYPDMASRKIGKYMIKIIAAKAPSSLMHMLSHGSHIIDWRLDPDMQRAIISNGRGLKCNDLNRTYIETETADDDPLPGTLPDEFFWMATGVFPLTGRPMPQRPDGIGPLCLREIARTDDFSFVRPELELVDGRWCHVLERPGHDVLWLDAERGCTLAAREMHFTNGVIRTWRIECLDQVEPEAGIWLPRRLRNIQFGASGSENDAPLVEIHRSEMDVTQISVNAVTDDVFDFKPLPGSLQLNAKSDVPRQATEGGTDLLDSLVGFVTTARADVWSSAAADKPDDNFARPVVTGFCVGALIALLLPSFTRRNAPSPGVAGKA